MMVPSGANGETLTSYILATPVGTAATFDGGAYVEFSALVYLISSYG